MIDIEIVHRTGATTIAAQSGNNDQNIISGRRSEEGRKQPTRPEVILQIAELETLREFLTTREVPKILITLYPTILPPPSWHSGLFECYYTAHSQKAFTEIFGRIQFHFNAFMR